MKQLLAFVILLFTVSAFGANPSYKDFRGINGILVTSNPPQGTIVFDGSGIMGPTGGVSAATATNIVLANSSLVAPPISSVQFNSNGILQGSAAFTFTNGLVGIGTALPLVALHINNDGAVSSPHLRFEKAAADVRWEFAISSNPETYNLGLGRVGDATYAMVWELGGNVGIGTTNPTSRLDVQGRTTLRSNVFLPNISSNASPVAFLATDAAGEVFETATPTGGSTTPAPPLSSVQFNSNGVMQGSSGFVFTNGEVYANGPGITNVNRPVFNRFFIAGSSLSGPSATWWSKLTNGMISVTQTVNTAVGGNTLADLTNEYPTAVAPYNPTTNDLFSVEIGVNDFKNFYAADYIVELNNYLKMASSNGATMMVWTIMPRVGDFDSIQAETNRMLINNWIRTYTNAFILDADKLFDNESNLNYFASDAIHLNDSAGTIAAGLVKRTLQDPKRGRPAEFVAHWSNTVALVSRQGVVVVSGDAGGTYVDRLGVGTNKPFAGALHVRPAVDGTNTLVIDDQLGRRRIQMGTLPGQTTYGGIWAGQVTPSTANVLLTGNGEHGLLNAGAGGLLQFGHGGNTDWYLDTSGNLVGSPDNLRGIGLAASGRPANIHIAGGGAGTVGAVIGGSVLVVTNDKVGVGTIAPSSTLDVTGKVNMASAIVSNIITFWPPSPTTRMHVGWLSGNTAGGIPEPGTNFGFFSHESGRFSLYRSGLPADENWTVTGGLSISNMVGSGDHVAVNAAGRLMRTNITGGGFSVSGNSNQIPYLNTAGTGFLFGQPTGGKESPGFGFSRSVNGGIGGLMIMEDQTNANGLVAIGPPVYTGDIVTFVPSLSVSNRYAYSGSGNKVTQEMVRVTFLDVTDGSDPESFIQTWRHAIDAGGETTLAAGLRRDGQLTVAHGTYYPSNSLASTMPTAAQLGPGGYWVGNSNGTLVTVYSTAGATTVMKVLAP